MDEKDERNKKNIKPAFLAAGIAGTSASHSRTSPQSEGQSSNLQAAVKVGENNIVYKIYERVNPKQINV